MMTKKMITLSLLALSLATVAFAAEYQEPEVKFKKHAVASKEMKVVDFGEHYKIEQAAENDRQIASESDENYEKLEADKPQPWTFKTKADH